MNYKRGLAYFASCEIFTIWYSVKKHNSLYGFESNYKLKCKTFSPMDGVRLYPIIDEYDDMQAMSFEYDKTVSDKETITFFETFTENYHFIWKKSNLGEMWEEVTAQVDEDGNTKSGEEIIIRKIPGAYLSRPHAIYEGLDNIRSEFEYNVSRNSNVIAYNSAPIAKVKGGIVGQEKREKVCVYGESRMMAIFHTYHGISRKKRLAVRIKPSSDCTGCFLKCQILALRI